MKMLPIIDLEASGLKRNSFPIEVGIFLPEENYSDSWLIKPTEQWISERQWDTESEEIHGISLDHLNENGLNGLDVCNKLNSILRGTVIFSDAPDFDSMWINILFNEWNTERLFDIRSIFEADIKIRNVTYKEVRDLKKKIAKEHNLKQHRASDDAFIISHMVKEITFS